MRPLAHRGFSFVWTFVLGCLAAPAATADREAVAAYQRALDDARALLSRWSS